MRRLTIDVMWPARLIIPTAGGGGAGARGPYVARWNVLLVSITRATFSRAPSCLKSTVAGTQFFFVAAPDPRSSSRLDAVVVTRVLLSNEEAPWSGFHL